MGNQTKIPITKFNSNTYLSLALSFIMNDAVIPSTTELVEKNSALTMLHEQSFIHFEATISFIIF